jgi:hypothetical protein
MSSLLDPMAREDAVLARLRERYEGQGYSFFAHPPRDIVPQFLQNYRPDGLALKGDGGVIIEIKHSNSERSRTPLPEIARRIEGQKEWTFQVFVAEDALDDDPVRPPSMHRLVEELSEIDRLIGADHLRAAFILEWAALEAATRASEAQPGTPKPAMGPGEEARRLRKLARIRNAVVHGDLSATVDLEDTKFLRSIIGDLLQPTAA